MHESYFCRVSSPPIAQPVFVNLQFPVERVPKHICSAAFLLVNVLLAQSSVSGSCSTDGRRCNRTLIIMYVCCVDFRTRQRWGKSQLTYSCPIFCIFDVVIWSENSHHPSQPHRTVATYSQLANKRQEDGLVRTRASAISFWISLPTMIQPPGTHTHQKRKETSGATVWVCVYGVYVHACVCVRVQECACWFTVFYRAVDNMSSPSPQSKKKGNRRCVCVCLWWCALCIS